MSPALGAALFWVAAIACAVAQVAILRAVIGQRAERGRASDAAGLARRPGGTAVGEIIWAVVPAIALAILLAVTWRAVRRDGPPPAAESSAAAHAGPLASAATRP